jgi:hypothetical protein
LPFQNLLSLYKELAEYLAARVPPDDLMAFKASKQQEKRAQLLTDRNKAGTLTVDQRAELDQMLEFDFFVTYLKAKSLRSKKPR